MKTTQSTLFNQHQIKLKELSVYNWGSFQELHTAHIDPFGTLITGDNGAGKSTLIDGLMALLLPAGKASFNVAAAQGDRTDRSLLSYIRGSYGSAHDGSHTRTKSKREGATATALRALYQADDGTQISLLALFWITVASNALADVKRLYLVAKCNVTLQYILTTFDNGDIRVLKQTLKQNPDIRLFDDNFSAYQEAYRRLLMIDNRNAPALLSRSLGLKKIDDLTNLLRDLVLEPSTVRDDARKAVAEFDDLRSIHDRLLDARQQRDALIALPEINANYQLAHQQIINFNSELENLSPYFAEQAAQLWQQRMMGLEQTLETLEQTLAQLQQQHLDATKDVEARHADYLQAGGERIEMIKKDLFHTQQTLTRTNVAASQYQTIVKTLTLDDELSQNHFNQNQNAATKALQQTDTQRQQAEQRVIDASVELSKVQQNLKQLQQDIQAIEARPDSNISNRYQQLRDKMLDVLQLESNELMFIGELIDVEEPHRAWQGAIERALGGLRTTLVISQQHFSLITRWLNSQHTGLHVRVQVVRDVEGQATFKANGYLKKLQWRQHPYREWLKHHLARFDLACVETTKILDQTPFSMTQSGLMHLDKGRFEKKDQHAIDDRRHWALGFSNKSRLALLKQDEKQLKITQQQCLDHVTQQRQQLDNINQQLKLWTQLTEIEWPQIDVPYWQQQVSKLTQDLALLEQQQHNLNVYKQRWETAKATVEAIQQKLTTQQQAIWQIKEKQQQAQTAIQQAQQIIATFTFSSSAKQRLQQRIGILKDDSLNHFVQLEQKQRDVISQAKDQATARQTKYMNRSIGIISAFKGRWETICVDWDASFDSIQNYLKHLQALEEEGLPALVEQFQARLNRHTAQSLASIREKIESEREDIRERIDTINDVLQRTEFRPGSYLRLGSRKDKYPHVQDFEQQLKQVFHQIDHDDHELRFKQLQKVVESLDKASNSTTAHNLESLRLLDPRYQMSFYAEEIDRDSLKIRDVLESSSGKSGGEKEAFAGTIVAASLAYVLTPENSDRPVYCTVFLDEAFSNTAEAVSRRVLRVFRELHIHVNLITPYKNLNLARESAHSLIIAERNSNTHESQLSEVTWQEIDQHNQQHMAKLGIEVVSH